MQKHFQKMKKSKIHLKSPSKIFKLYPWGEVLLLKLFVSLEISLLNFADKIRANFLSVFPLPTKAEKALENVLTKNCLKVRGVESIKEIKKPANV